MPFWIRKEQKPRKFTLHFSQLCLSINLLHKTFAIVIYSESQWHLSEWELHWFALCRHVGDGTTYPVPPWCSSFVLRDVTPLLNLIANWFCFSYFIFLFLSFYYVNFFIPHWFSCWQHLTPIIIIIIILSQTPITIDELYASFVIYRPM